MKNSLFFTLISISFAFFGNAQKLEKIKGNKNVFLNQTEINSFHTIALDEDFEVEIVYNKTPSVEIETDENLHDFIEFKVSDSVLTFNNTRKITSKKRLNIKIAYNDALKHIKTSNRAEINSLSMVELTNGSLITTESSEANLTIKSNNFKFEATDKSKIKLNLTADSCVFYLNGNSKLEAFINTPMVKARLFERSQANIEGFSDNAILNLDDASRFNGKNFTMKTCNLTAETNSNSTIEVTETLTIEASGSSEIYLYENPKIQINKFTDTVKLQKKVK